MITSYAGELAAFGTVLCFTIGSQCFEAAGKKVGSIPVNLIRLVIAFLLFCVTQYFRSGEVIPTTFPAEAWKWLLVSGVIGFAVGDLFLFRAFVEIGPRLSMLIMSLTAPITAVVGWLFLKEQYSLLQWLGVLVTISGVAWVILNKNGNGRATETSRFFDREITLRGVLLAVGGAFGQSIGYIFSKVGMMNNGTYLDPFSSTQIRTIGGIIAFCVLFTVFRWWHRISPAVKHRAAMGYISAGAFLGPYLGVALSLLALHYTTAGVASTIMSLVPITLIPFAVFIHRERVSVQALMGTIAAIVGVVMVIN